MSTLSSTGKVPVGGAQIHYEAHGDGPPLVLLHGGVTPSITLGALLEAMAKAHKVIAIHLRGHGFSTDSDGPWSAEMFADDVAAVLEHLGIGKARVMGYSLGAAVAQQVAIRHPEVVEKLVSVSAGFSTDGDYPEVRQAFAEMPGNAAAIGQQIAASPLAQLYPGIDWETIIRKTGEMNQSDHDWTEGIRTIKARHFWSLRTQIPSGPSTWSRSGSCSAAVSATPGSTGPSAPQANSPSFPTRRTTA